MTQLNINIDNLLSMKDNSITDADTIRQISVYHIENNNDIANKLLRKIDSRFQIAGLYPYEIKKYDIKPEIIK